MVDFSKLKNQSLEKLTKKLEEQATATSYGDDRYWRPTVDKAGNGSAVIRFLPVPPQDVDDENALPWVKYYDHNFKGPGGWYIERCLTTLSQPDPCAEENNKLWNTGVEANKNIARQRKRNQRIVSGIQVVSDPAHPENDGLVFLYRYGPKIFEKIQNAMNGDEDTAGFNPFDFAEGANFRLKIKTTTDNSSKAKFPSYEDSKFTPNSALSEDNSELEAIWNKQHSLLAEVTADKYKSYDELQKQLHRVLGMASPSNEAVIPKNTAETKPIEVTQTAPVVKEETSMPWDATGEEDDALKMFQKLANS